jgi:uncharacterized protein (DUF433 family)
VVPGSLRCWAFFVCCHLFFTTITISPEVQNGTPVFPGTRVPIKNLFDYLRGGDTTAEFLHDFPSVTQAQVSGLLKVFENLITMTPHEKKAAA